MVAFDAIASKPSCRHSLKDAAATISPQAHPRVNNKRLCCFLAARGAHLYNDFLLNCYATSWVLCITKMADFSISQGIINKHCYTSFFICVVFTVAHCIQREFDGRINHPLKFISPSKKIYWSVLCF